MMMMVVVVVVVILYVSPLSSERLISGGITITYYCFEKLYSYKCCCEAIRPWYEGWTASSSHDLSYALLLVLRCVCAALEVICAETGDWKLQSVP